MSKFWLITYDIANPKRLRRVASLMSQFGIRAQKSVFECWLTDAQLRDLRKRLEVILHKEQDSVRYYPLCADCRKQAEQEGEELIEAPKNFYIV